jgi:hypothetical protein
MPVDLHLEKWLNLVRTSPRFVLKDTPDGGAKVLPLDRVPANDGFYWVHGRTILASGRTLESVFHVDTDSHGKLHGAYWWINQSWVSSQDPDVESLLGAKGQIFPFNWEFSVPLEEDVHRS